MTTLTVNIKNDSDLPVLQEILNRFGLSYTVDTDKEYPFSDAEIKSLVKTKQDFIEGKTTARNWTDIEDDLNRAYN
jgi:signal recognition particle subunit SEC65